MTSPLTVIIIDDEGPARKRMRSMLTEHSDVEIIGECANGPEAVAAIRELQPALVFLDVQMPTLDGFDVLLRLDEDELPSVVFVTAYDEYALRAFDVNAVDFLLKPFDEERLARALERVKQQIMRTEAMESQNSLRSLLRELRESRPGKEAQQHPDRLAIKSDGAIIFVRTEHIDWIESAQNYVTLHCGDQKHMMRGSLKELEAKLDPDKFVRVHRSSIVNVDSVKEITPWFHGDQRIRLKTGAQLTLSRQRKDVLNRFFGSSGR